MIAIWLRQALGIARLELRRNLFGARAIPLYLLGLMPVGVALLFLLITMQAEVLEDLRRETEAVTFFAWYYRFIQLVLYFACVWTFINLFRGEILDRSLHYYFLTPVRREVLVAGKYLSAVVSTAVVFGVASAVCFAAIHFRLGSGVPRGTSVALGHLFGYEAVTLLAVVGYGAIFTFAGLFLRNPLVPAVAIFLWEAINGLLPSALKKLSVIFYLQSLYPVPIQEGGIALITDPVPAWAAVPGLLAFSALVLVASALRIRRMEIAYATE